MHKGFWEKLQKPIMCLAPMADVTDASFRRIIAKYGKPDVMWTEFVSADGLFRGGYDALIHDLKYTEAERPIVAQFFSRDPAFMKRAAELAVELGFDGVDINMGCPDKNVCKQGAGAAMIQEPDVAVSVIKATMEGAGELPVSVKTRIGFNAIETDTWIPTLLETDLAAITLHCRTKKEKSKVPAHWDEVGKAVEIRDSLGSDTLILGNGDVEDLEDAQNKVKESGADGAMLGRAIFGNPWLFSNQPRPDLSERLKVLREHIKLFDELLGDVKNFAVMKKHFKSYIQGSNSNKSLVRQLMGTIGAQEAIDVLSEHV